MEMFVGCFSGCGRTPDGRRSVEQGQVPAAVPRSLREEGRREDVVVVVVAAAAAAAAAAVGRRGAAVGDVAPAAGVAAQPGPAHRHDARRAEALREPPPAPAQSDIGR